VNNIYLFVNVNELVCVYVLAQATKHASTQCVCKSHPEFQGK